MFHRLFRLIGPSSVPHSGEAIVRPGLVDVGDVEELPWLKLLREFMISVSSINLSSNIFNCSLWEDSYLFFTRSGNLRCFWRSLLVGPGKSKAIRPRNKSKDHWVDVSQQKLVYFNPKTSAHCPTQSSNPDQGFPLRRFEQHGTLAQRRLKYPTTAAWPFHKWAVGRTRHAWYHRRGRCWETEHPRRGLPLTRPARMRAEAAMLLGTTRQTSRVEGNRMQ